jgi:hypothetical protein
MFDSVYLSFHRNELLYQSILAYPTSNPYPRAPQPQQSIYPQLYGNQQQYRPPYNQQQYRPSYNQQPGYNNTTVVVQPSPVYAGSGGYGGNRHSGMGSKVATAGLGFAGGTLFGGKILLKSSQENISIYLN